MIRGDARNALASTTNKTSVSSDTASRSNPAPRQNPTETGRDIRLRTTILYGIGEIPITVAMVLVGLFVLFFYNSVMKLPGTLVGIAGAVGLLWDSVIDPLIGYQSDRCNSRWGRRHAYMLLGCPAMGVFFWLLLSPPRNLGTTQLFLWLLGATVLFRFAGALYRIPYLSLGAELSSDYQGRTTISSVRSFFGLCGTLAAATLSFAVFFSDKSSGLDLKLNYLGYQQLGAWFGLVMIAAGLVATFGTWKHRTKVLPPTALQNTPNRLRFRSGFRAAFQNASFRRLWFTCTFFFFAVVFNAVVSVHYFTWYAQITDNQSLSMVQACFYIGALAGVLFWLGISRYNEKRNLCLWSIAGTAFLMCSATLLIGPGHLFGTGNIRPLIIGHALAGAMASALWVLPASMLADIVDEDELSTGDRREGVFFGIINFGEKIAAGASLLLAGILLDHFVKLVPGVTPDSAARVRIGLIYGLIPGLLLLASAILLTRYGLDRKAVVRIQSELRARNRIDSGLVEVSNSDAQSSRAD